MRRGDLIRVALPGSYGKPRPAVVIQSDRLRGSGSVIVCLVTSDLADAPTRRVTLAINDRSNLTKVSQVQIDKIFAQPREKCGDRFGRVSDAELAAINRALVFVLGLADRP